MKKVIYFTALLFLCSFVSFAQKATLKGTITDKASNEPLPGATIMVKGTTIGMITDFEGNYELPNLNPGK